MKVLATLFGRCAGNALVLAALSMTVSAQAQELTIQFAEGVNALPDGAAGQLATFAGAAKGSTSTIVINDRAARLRAGLQDLMQVQVRSLRVFKLLVEHGIDPARIVVRSPAEKPQANSVVLQMEDAGDGDRRTVGSRPESAVAGPQEFRFYFAKNSGDPLPVNDDDLARFLASLGQPGNASIVIEGYTDTDGETMYNQILSDLRALRVFELVVRAGLPATRIQPLGLGVAREHGSDLPADKRQASRRHVVVRWTAMTPSVELSAPSGRHVENLPAAEPASEPGQGPLFDLAPFAGVLLPQGELASHAKQGTVFGLGVSRTFWRHDAGVVRAALSVSNSAKLEPKEADRDGTLNIRLLTLRADYVYGSGFAKPFLGAGFGRYLWNATIAQSSTLLENTGGRADSGAIAAVGMDLAVGDGISLAPEISYHRAGGSLNEAFVAVLFAARWGI